MAIEIQSQLITVPGAQLTTSGSGVVYGMFANEAFSMIYAVVRDATNNAEFNWKRIDVTNPSAPAVSPWSVTDSSYPTNTGDSHGNGLFFDTTTGLAYGLFLTTGKINLMRINISTGLVEYSNRELTLFGGASTFTSVLGVAIAGGSLFALLLASTGVIVIAKFTMSDFNSTWSNSVGWVTNVFASSWNTVKSGAQPVPSAGLTVAQDGNLLVFYDVNNTAAKYLASSLMFSGTTAFAVADMGTAFSRNGYIYQTNQNFFTTTNLTIQKWLDRSTAVISQDKSVVSMPDRIVQVAENTSLAVTFKARDGFGTPMTNLNGLMCRFHVVTNRGVIDGDDGAISASSTGPFRDGNNVPILRQVDVPFNASGEAVAYFQSARYASTQSVEDIVRITYPPA